MRKLLETAAAFLMLSVLMGVFVYALITPDPVSEAKNRQWAAEAAERDAEWKREQFRECLHRELARWNHEPTDEQYEAAEAYCDGGSK
jgi:hypothetical protein